MNIALKLADTLDTTIDFQMRAREAAAELRRLTKVSTSLLEALKTLTSMAESFPSELHKDHPDVIAARAAIANANPPAN